MEVVTPAQQRTDPTSEGPYPGLLSCAFYVAANGFVMHTPQLLLTCRELGSSVGEVALLRCLLVHDARAPGPGLVALRPRLLAAVRVGAPDRIATLVDAGADVRVRDGLGRTAFMVAALHGRAAAMSVLLATQGVDAALVAARLPAGTTNEGHSAFSLVCQRLADMHALVFNAAERAEAKAVARLLASSPFVSPADLGGLNATALAWACEARLGDVVALWLEDVRCTPAVVAQLDADNASAFSIACGLAGGTRVITYAFSRGTLEERKTAAAIVRMLAASRHVRPGDIMGDGATALAWACTARVRDVVERWMGTLDHALDALNDTLNVTAPRAAHDDSCFSWACRAAADKDRKLDSHERADAAAIVRMLAASRHMRPGDIMGDGATALAWACTARVRDVVERWMGTLDSFPDVVKHRDDNGDSAFSRACLEVADVQPVDEEAPPLHRRYPDDNFKGKELSHYERTEAAAIVRLLAAHVDPADLGGFDATALTWSCEARMPDVVASFLAYPRCTAEVITRLDPRGDSALSRACLWACDEEHELTVAERSAAAACSRALVQHLQPEDSSDVDATVFELACAARLCDVIELWLSNTATAASVSSAIDASTLFSKLCGQVTHVTPRPVGYFGDSRSTDLTALERKAAATCALAVSQFVQPNTECDAEATALAWACTAGLHSLVARWLAGPLCTAALIAREDEDDTAFSRACAVAGGLLPEPYDECDEREAFIFLSERKAAAACARALVRTTHVVPDTFTSMVPWSLRGRAQQVCQTSSQAGWPPLVSARGPQLRTATTTALPPSHALAPKPALRG